MSQSQGNGFASSYACASSHATVHTHPTPYAGSGPEGAAAPHGARPLRGHAPYDHPPHDHPPYEQLPYEQHPYGQLPHARSESATPHPGPGHRPEPEREPEPVAYVPAPGGRAALRRAARTQRAAERPEVFRKLLPQALVVAFLAGGTSAFVAHDKSVALDVDGSSRTVHTFAGDVEQLLEDEGVELGPHDAVRPARDAPLSDGDEVGVSHGRPLLLTLDGQRRQVWTTARTVGGALRELGVRTEGARISAARSAPLGRHGRELEVWTERTLTFLVDGRTQPVRTSAATVRTALAQAGIVLRGGGGGADGDTASVPLGSFPRDGQTVTVTRIAGAEKTREERVPYPTVRREDPRLREGTEVVSRQGRPGLRKVTYQLRTVNGVRQEPKRLGSEVVNGPRTQVVRVGTGKLPESARGAEGLNWQALAQCESGGRPDAVDPSGTYGGLYQFDTRTWQGLGGQGRPQDATADEQTRRAKKLYVARGASPWPVCGRKLSQ